MGRPPCGCCLLALFMTGYWLQPACAESRYIAETVAGSRWEGRELHDWHDPRAQPRLDNRKLFDEPLRWVMDAGMPPAGPLDACVELFGGDCLPGRVIGASDGTAVLGERYAPHLLLEPSIGLDTSEGPVTGGVKVATKWLKRVVWQRRGDARYRPGTVFFRDGRQLAYRSIRWYADSVQVLVESDTREVPFSQIAELHLPNQDPWEAWFDQLAAVCPDGVGQIVQIETGDGLRVTASADRWRATSHGGGQRENWRHLLQPAWADEPLWVQVRTVRVWRFFAPQEVPLSAIEPTQAVFKAALGGGWWPQRDRNVQGGPLQSAEIPYGWGLGVHAYSELEFPLPKLAKSFRTRYALDQVAGQGGCVKATITAGVPGSAPLLDTPVLVGTSEAKDSGVLSLALPENAPRRLTLSVDPVLNNRPSGADPFEIRDVFDWHQPLIELDLEALKPELERRAAESITAWTDWTLVTAEARPAIFHTDWDPFEVRSNRFSTLVTPRAGAITLMRKWPIPQDARWLMLRVHRPEKQKQSSTIQVRIDGKAVAEFPATARPSWQDPDPVFIPVDAWRGRTAVVELSQMAGESDAWVEWRSVSLVADRPMLRTVFDDEPAFLDELVEGEALPRFDTEDRQRGRGSLRITPGEKGAAMLPRLSAVIRENPKLGEYRFLRFAWKKRDGGSIRLHLANDGQWGTDELRDARASLRYVAGRNAEHVRAVQLDGKAPDEWQVVIRDLYGDFGPFTLTGLKFDGSEEGTASFDGIVLGRRREDLDRLDQKIDDPFTHLSKEAQANLAIEAHTHEDLHRALTEFAPQFSCATIGWEGLWLLKEHAGRKRVLRTAPPDNDKPCVLRAPLLLPKDKPAQLRLSVGHHEGRDWKLDVRVNGQSLHETQVSKETAPEGWLDVTVDLGRFAGQNVLIELRQSSRTNHHGYWSRIEIGP